MTFQDATVLAPFIAAILVALAILTVDFIFPGRKVPALIATFTGLALVAALVAHHRPEHVRGLRRRLRRGPADHVPRHAVHLDRRAHDRLRPGLPRGAGPAGAGVRRHARVRDVGRDAARRLRRPAGPVPGPRAHGPAGLRPGRLPQDRRVQHRGRDQVLPARLVLERDLPVRPRVRLGHHGHHEHRRGGGLHGPGRGRGHPDVAGPGPGPRVHDHGRRVQDRGGAVPLLDAGRVPGLPDPGHRLPLRRPQDRGVRADHPAVRRGSRGPRDRLEHRVHGPRGPDDDPRQPGRAPAGQRQAHAGVLVHRPHRLHAGRLRGLRRREHRGHGGAAVLRRRLRVHEPRRIRGGRRPPAADGRHQQPVHVRGAHPPRARRWPGC